MLNNKTILLGVTGSIAAYKTASLASALVKKKADVHVLMTKNAANFINPITFETLTGNKCLIDTFDRNFKYDVEHISLAAKADILMVAPASADIIAKLAHGIADDMLTTTALACQCPILIAPTMNTRMYANSIVQDNMDLLEKYGMKIVDPAVGYLACRETGVGKMPEPETLLEHILLAVSHEKDMEGKRVLVTAGPTQEAIDPVRYITNHSTGKMGYALAMASAARGAEVTLVSGPVALKQPVGVEFVPVKSAKQMFEAVTSRSGQKDIIIKAAAVADYRPSHVSTEKVKKSGEEMEISLERTDDILKYLGEHKREGQFLCGFSMETENMLENSRKKLRTKKIDMIVANNLKTKGAGFGTDTNVITMITPDREISLDIMTKSQVSHRILDEILRIMK